MLPQSETAGPRVPAAVPYLLMRGQWPPVSSGAWPMAGVHGGHFGGLLGVLFGVAPVLGHGTSPWV